MSFTVRVRQIYEFHGEAEANLCEQGRRKEHEDMVN